MTTDDNCGVILNRLSEERNRSKSVTYAEEDVVSPRQYAISHLSYCHDHPPYSPDLTPSDFLLFPKLQVAFEGQIFVERRGHHLRKEQRRTVKGMDRTILLILIHTLLITRHRMLKKN